MLPVGLGTTARQEPRVLSVRVESFQPLLQVFLVQIAALVPMLHLQGCLPASPAWQDLHVFYVCIWHLPDHWSTSFVQSMLHRSVHPVHERVFNSIFIVGIICI